MRTTTAKHSDRGRETFRNNALYWFKVLYKVNTKYINISTRFVKRRIELLLDLRF